MTTIGELFVYGYASLYLVVAGVIVLLIVDAALHDRDRATAGLLLFSLIVSYGLYLSIINAL